MPCSTEKDHIVARAWLFFMSKLSSLTESGRKTVIQDERRMAMIALKISINDVTSTEEESVKALRILADQVKRAQYGNRGLVSELVLRSRNQRIKLTAIKKKKTALQQHLETLEASELNQQVISSVKQTSAVLKSMGLEKQLETVEGVMIDMQENHDDITAIQSELGMHVDELDDSEMEQELRLLLEEDGEVSVIPSVRNTMTPSPITTPLTEKSPVDLEKTEPEESVTYASVARIALHEV